MCNTLTLDSSGTGGCDPDPNPWKPTSGKEVTITNSSGSEQTLSNISKGCLVTKGGGTVTSITIADTDDWTGKAGAKKGTYKFDDGLPQIGVRDGTIDPS